MDLDPDLDLDLAQVRAFTVAAGLRHFGRAAGELGITQQALSKRVARLEARLGVRLLDRGDGRGVRLTAAGERFLGPARHALAAGTAAVSAALAVPGPGLRLDVWGHLYAPLRTLAQVLADTPGLAVETGSGRDHAAVAQALRRGDADAGLGRVPLSRTGGAGGAGGFGDPAGPGGGRLRGGSAGPGGGRLRGGSAGPGGGGLGGGSAGPGGGGLGGGSAGPGGGGRGGPDGRRDGLVHRVVRLEPVDAVVSAAHPLADAARLRPADLRGSTLRCPAEPGRLDFLARFADRFGIAHRTGGPNLGPAPFLAAVRDDPACFSLLPADAVPDTDPAASHGLRFVPLADPVPLYAWSLVWRAGPEGTPGLRPLLDAFARTGRARRWLEYEPGRDWLPEGGLSAVS
ncbi:LysR family transcriptional regulator [Streptomyces thermolilacinus]|uniref:LysR family transcriptional regulator n=1 Tax=Streptomyces thermolilacinus TaxID=285540 RepID=UPI00340B66A5